MYPHFRANVDVMHALYDVLESIGKRASFEQDDTFYLTIAPEDPHHAPLVIRCWSVPGAADGRRHILMAHYVTTHGQLSPCPEYVVTNQGEFVWMRTCEETATDRHALSRDECLRTWAKHLREQFVGAAAQQREQGRADLQLVAEVDVLISIEAQRQQGHEPASPEELRQQAQACVRAFDAFLSNRTAARAALVQATYLALRPEPEPLYLLCSASGTWMLLTEGDMTMRMRWQFAQRGPRPASFSVQLPTVADQRKHLYHELYATAGYPVCQGSDPRTLPQIAQELGHRVDTFIEHEVEWSLDRLLACLLDLRQVFTCRYGLQDEDPDEPEMRAVS